VGGGDAWRTVTGAYRESEEGAEVNKVQISNEFEIPVLGVGGDFFFGEVPREQMEKVASNARGVVIHPEHNIALEQTEELTKAYLEFFDGLN